MELTHTPAAQPQQAERWIIQNEGLSVKHAWQLLPLLTGWFLQLPQPCLLTADEQKRGVLLLRHKLPALVNDLHPLSKVGLLLGHLFL